LINARAESIAEKPAFRDAVRHRRALVVASGFYEWKKTAEGERNPWYITRSDGAPLAMAAIWQDWADPAGARLRTCALVTTAANKEMGRIHHRMPVVLAPDDWRLWLGELGHGAAKLMKPAAEGVLTMHRVSRAVNSNRASGPDLIKPVGK
jgi:putative SOS response-associated peptidase YedK